MFMLCWFYCVPFLKLLYFLSGPFVFLLALFMRRRAVYRRHAGLAKAAFGLMFAAVIKLFVLDIRYAGQDLLCSGFLPLPCSSAGWQALQGIGFALLVSGGYLVWRAQARFSPDDYAALPKLGREKVDGWAGLGMTMVLLMAVWQLAPWFCYLVMGRMPDIFRIVPWPPVALATFGVLLTGFWKLEACPEFFPRENGSGSARSKAAWVPRDTLWLAVFLYAVTLALSYVAGDILKAG